MAYLQHLMEVALLVMVMGLLKRSFGAVAPNTMTMVDGVNKEGPFLGIVVSQPFEMKTLLQSRTFVPNETLPYLDIFGRRYRIGRLEKERVIIVSTGMGMRFGDGLNAELAFEPYHDYTRKIGYLNFTSFNNHTNSGNADQNLLNNVWYQPEEIYPIDGVPEVRQHTLWIPVDKHYFAVSKKIKGLKLGQCVNSTYLPRAPMVVTVERGVSASMFLDNSAYRQFLHSKFNATAIDMERASIALVCRQLKMPFIAIRSLSDLAGQSSFSNEVSNFSGLAIQNSVEVLLRLVALLSSS